MGRCINEGCKNTEHWDMQGIRTEPTKMEANSRETQGTKWAGELMLMINKVIKMKYNTKEI